MKNLSAALLGALLLASTISVSASAQTAKGVTPPAATTPGPRPAAGPAAQAGVSEEFATMRDGIKLAADVYLPAGKGPFPVVLSRTPYLKNPPAGAPTGNSAANAKRYTDAGFAYVLQDVRGKGHSEGFYAPYTDDIQDGYDSVEWAAKQSWSNGKIGITGASALGVTSNAAAMAAPPHLVAAYVLVAPFDRLQNAYIGGVLKEKDTITWLAGQGVKGPQAEYETRSRATDDVFWNRFAMSTNRKYIRIPIYNVGGWYDIFNHGNISNFEYLQNEGAVGARGNQKLFMGPFGHGPLSGDLAYPGQDNMAANGDQEIRWFKYWLKGEQNGIMDEPPVTYFMMASARKGALSPKNQVMHAANWPIAHRDTRYYFEPGLKLASVAPKAAAAKISYRFDPKHPAPTIGGANLTFDRGPMDQRPIGKRQDYLRFETPVLDKDVSIAGPVSVELYGATDGPDTDFMAKLVDVYPDGYEALVLDAPIRTRYRNGRDRDAVKMMVPGAPEKLTIDLWSTALTFEKGHKIALHITSSNSPRFAVNPNTGEPEGMVSTKPRVATNTIYMDKDHPSALVLPVIYP